MTDQKVSAEAGFEVKLDTFRDVITKTHGSLDPQGPIDVYLWDDWAQACWEVFVERPLDLALEVYGEGADINGASSRYYAPHLAATHRVQMMPRAGTTMRDILSGGKHDPDDVQFDGFVTRDEGWFKIAPPFDLTLGSIGDLRVLFDLDDVKFVVVPL